MQRKALKQHPLLDVLFSGFRVPVNVDVELDACLPLPSHYAFPTHGRLHEDARLATLALKQKRHLYLWGDAGSGKDALVHAWSYLTHTPAKIFQIRPGMDIQSWFFSHEFTQEGTFWRDGPLLRSLRDGYISPITGRCIPYIILITDLDRATLDQQEALRMALDSIEGRVEGPNGVTYPVVPGTVIVGTGNTIGGGDDRGRYVSAKLMDASILDRFERVIQFHGMVWEDEEAIVRNKFPLLHDHNPKGLTHVGNCVHALRDAIERGTLQADFSHRATCAWMGQAQDILECRQEFHSGGHINVWQESFRAYQDKLPDRQTREQARLLIDPHLPGGAFKGDVPKR